MRMKWIAVLTFVLGYCLCQRDSNESYRSHGSKEKSNKVCRCRKPTFCCDAKTLNSIAKNLGIVGQKVALVKRKLLRIGNELASTQSEVQRLSNHCGSNRGLSQVAFSAALYESKSGNTGPFNAATPLRYKNVFSNAGNGYNPSTGMFTAPVKGMYFFRFSMFNNIDSGANSVVSLMKNGKRLTSVWDTSGTDSNDMGSNAVVIPLQVGDNVYVELQQNRVVYDDNMNYNTFSGFFLFAL